MVFSIGPIQPFIAAARKTSDLWFESHILSELSKKLAFHLRKDYNASLIFPNPKSDALLEPSVGPAKFNVANVILCQLSQTNSDPPSPEKISHNLQTMIQSHLFKLIQENNCMSVAELLCLNYIQPQLDDFLEFYSAWILFDETRGYQACYKDLMVTFAARKNLHNFNQDIVYQKLLKEEDGLTLLSYPPTPKSSLDGSRDSVLNQKKLKQKTHQIKQLKQKLSLKEGEQLHAMDLLKLLGGSAHHFPSISRVAIDPWIRFIHESENWENWQPVWNQIENLFGELVEEFGSEYTNRIDEYYQKFPFDGQILYPARLETKIHEAQKMLKEQDGQSEQIDDINESITKLKDLQTSMNKLYNIKDLKNPDHHLTPPSPYVGIIAADGDHMGKTLSTITSVADHRQFSRNLAHFADRVREIVENT
jgi:CRISPR-associated protein Cmr2